MNDRRRELRWRLSWVLLFAALLLCWSVGPVLAEPQPGEPSPGSETETSEQRGDDPRLRPPTGLEISQGIKEAERREIEQAEWLANPGAARERELSRTAYAALAPADAEALVKDVFADYLAALDSDPARFLSGAQLVRPLGPDETAAVVKEDGDGSLMDATIPVRTEDESGDLAKVDLSLEVVGGGWETANALTDVTLPESADGPLEIGHDGVTVTQVDAGEGQSGRLPEGESVYYHEALPDIGTIAAPVAGGAEVFNVLYSEESAERLEFDLDLPAGAELRADRLGGAEIVRNGEIAGYIRFPTAVDAQGSQVPVELRLDGDMVILDVEHRGADVAYPILRTQNSCGENWYTANWYNGNGLAALTDGMWSPYASVPWIYVQTTPYYATFGGSNRGLFLSGASGTWDANRYGQFTYTVPDWDSYIDHSSLLPFWRDDHGCGYTTYKSPTHYVGHWDCTQWIGPVKINEARTLGYSNLGQWGKQLVIGIGSGNGGYNPCVRDIYVGGVGMWLDDWSQPSLAAKPPPNGWTQPRSGSTRRRPTSASASSRSKRKQPIKTACSGSGKPSTRVSGPVPLAARKPVT